MDFPRPSKSAGELLGDLKGKLGFRSGKDDYDPYDDYQDPQYDDYDDYASDQGGYDDEYESALERPADPYDRLEYTTRSTGRSYARGHSVSANLVNSEDLRAAAVRKSTQEAPASRGAHAASPDESHRPIKGLDVPVSAREDFVSPYKSRADATPSTGSAGLDSLFTPSTSSAGGMREIVGISPRAYADVSTMAASVRRGAVVVLSMRFADPALAARMLDFSFGVASALGARVDFVADRTFAVMQGAALSSQERQELQQRGLV